MYYKNIALDDVDEKTCIIKTLHLMMQMKKHVLKKTLENIIVKNIALDDVDEKNMYYKNIALDDVDEKTCIIKTLHLMMQMKKHVL